MADPTIALQVRPPQPVQSPMNDPIQFLGGIMGLQRSALGLQTDQQTLQARQNLGNIMSGASDTQSGLAAAARDPGVAGFIPEVLNANTVNAQNAVALQQQQAQLAARQKAGAIMAQAPDLDTGVKALLADPVTAGFAPDVINTLQSVNQAGTAIGGERQAQALTGQQKLIQSLLPGINDPSTVKPIVDNTLAAMSPSARDANSKAYGNIVTSLTDGLPSDPDAAKGEYQRRLSAMLIGAGVPSDAIRSVTGTVPQGISMQPVGEGGALVPVQTGGPVTGAPSATIVGQPSAPVTGQSQTQQTANAARGGVAAGIDGDMTAQSALQPALNRINIMQDTLKDFQAGGGADVRQRLGTAMQAMKNAGLPISDDSIAKVANGSLPAGQVFDTEVKPLVLQSLRNDIQGTGRAMRTEVDSYLTSMDQTKDPAALMKLLNQARYSLQVGYDQSQKYVDFKDAQRQNDPSVAKYKDPSDFYAWYNSNYKPENLPQATPGGVSLAPRSSEGVKGIPQKDSRPALDSFFK